VSPRETRFSELYRQEYSAVYRFLARRSDSAADLAHETFLTAWRRLAEVPTDDGAARAWLFATARNHLLNDQRSVARADKLSVKISEHFSEAIAGPENGTIAAIDLAQAWRQLPAESQELLALFAWEHLTLNQAAQVLGISIPTVKSRLELARAQLRNLLAEIDKPANSTNHIQNLTTLGALS